MGALETPGPAAGGAPRSICVTLPMPTTLLSINARRRLHWRKQARIAKAQRHDAMLCAYAALSALPATLTRPLFPRGRVSVDLDLYRRPYQQAGDETAAVEAAKPWLDGIEDAAVYASDKQCTIGAVRWHPVSDEPRIEITLRAVDE